MRNRHPILPSLAAALALLLASAPPATHAATQPTPQPLPEGWKITARAPTLQALAANTHPTLQFADPRHTVFLWITQDDKKRLAFRLATPFLSASPRKPAEWVLASAPEFLGVGEDPLPLISIPLGQGPIPGPQMATQNWGRILASHPTQGTLYQIEYYYQTPAEGTRGYRLVILHDNDNRWRHILTTDSDFWDDTGTVETTRLHARWSAQGELQLTETWRSTARSPQADTPDPPPPVWIATYLYTGVTPFTKPTTASQALLIQPRQTFNRLLKDWIADTTFGESDAVRTKLFTLLRSDILERNPALRPDRLLPGQKLAIPASRELLVLRKKAGAATTFPAF